MFLPVLLVLACNDTDYTFDPMPPESVEYAPELVVDPLVLDFGAVAPDSVGELPVTLSNVGNARLEVMDIAVDGSESFEWGGQVAPFSLGAGASAQVVVRYTPHAEEETGNLVITSSESTLQETWVEMRGAGLFPILEIRPNPYDFGLVPMGCTYEAIIDLKNVGASPLEVLDVAHSGVGFELASVPDLPVVLEPGTETSVRVDFRPPSLATFEGSLWVTTNDVSGSGYAVQEATGVEWTDFEDEFWQADGPWPATDILFYVDQSGSMVDDQQNLQENFTQFTAVLEDFLDDWKIMVVTDDDGCHNEMILDPTTRHADEFFADAIYGASGESTEAGLTIAREALQESSFNGCNDGFLRSDAKTMIILISDEPEQSLEPWSDILVDILDMAPNASVSAIAGDVPDGCETAAAGYGYYEAAAATGGAFLSICEPDWGSKLRTLAWVTAAAPTDRFALTYPPEPSSLHVWVNDVESSSWTLDTGTNDVVFDEGATPGAGSHIVARYGLGCSAL